MEDLGEQSQFQPTGLKRKSGDWVVDMGVSDGLDVADLRCVEGDLEVVCLSQGAQKLSDPDVKARDFLIVDPVKDSTRHWTGICLKDFIKSVGGEMNWKAIKMLRDDVVCVVVYEAFKLLEEDFTVLMQSTLRLKENAKFVKHLRNFIDGAAKSQGLHVPPHSVWIWENVPFGVFAQALVLLLDSTYTTQSATNKAISLLAEGFKFFEEIMWKGIKSLQEDYEISNVLDAEAVQALEFLRNPASTEAVVREITACSLLRQTRNANSHPFSPIASHAVRESALALYSSLLTHEFTKDIRNIAVLGKVKLDLVSAEHTKLKQLQSTVRDSWFVADLEDDGSDDELGLKVSGIWES